LVAIRHFDNRSPKDDLVLRCLWSVEAQGTVNSFNAMFFANAIEVYRLGSSVEPGFTFGAGVDARQLTEQRR
jgi:hypothetical protein